MQNSEWKLAGGQTRDISRRVMDWGGKVWVNSWPVRGRVRGGLGRIVFGESKVLWARGSGCVSVVSRTMAARAERSWIVASMESLRCALTNVRIRVEPLTEAEA